MAGGTGAPCGSVGREGESGDSDGSVGLGWFAWQLSYCGLRTGMFPKAFCWFGYLSGFTGLLMAVTFIPTYLLMVLLWSGWLAVIMLRRAVSAALVP